MQSIFGSKKEDKKIVKQAPSLNETSEKVNDNIDGCKRKVNRS